MKETARAWVIFFALASIIGLIYCARPAHAQMYCTRASDLPDNQPTLDPIEREMIALINRYNRFYNPLQWDQGLTNEAHWMVRDSARRADGRDALFRYLRGDVVEYKEYSNNAVDSLGRDIPERLRSFGNPSTRAQAVVIRNMHHLCDASTGTLSVFKAGDDGKDALTNPEYRYVGIARLYRIPSEYLGTIWSERDWYWWWVVTVSDQPSSGPVPTPTPPPTAVPTPAPVLVQQVQTPCDAPRAVTGFRQVQVWC